MAIFTNYATLSYSGGTANSNTVTGEIRETLAVSKTAVETGYAPAGRITYLVSMINSGAAPLTGLTVQDNLGGYLSGENTLYPLSYTEGSARLYQNGVLQETPAVTAGPPLTFTGISVPAGGSALLVYQADTTGYAPLSSESAISNTVTVTGGGLTAPVTAEASVPAESRARLAVSKAVEPAIVSENGQLTYTFTIENTGNLPATAEDAVVLTDTFNPILDPIAVTLNGTSWTEGTNYRYDRTSGLFTTLANQLTVPAATFAQNANGIWTMTPGTTVLTVTGTV